MNREFLYTVKNYIIENDLISSEDIVAVGLSGGADSVCLLLVLDLLSKELNFELKAVHVEHGIRGKESISDWDFCRELCGQLDIELKSFQVDVPEYVHKEHLSEEEAARILRYDCYKKAAKSLGDNVKIALAHHSDDVAETMLFNLSRGTGIRGLCSIQPVAKREGYTVIRPLLEVDKKTILEVLAKEKQPYCTDATNMDIDISRNRIRHNVIPELEKINAKASEHMSMTAAKLKKITDYLDAQVKLAASEVIGECEDKDGYEIDVKKAAGLEDVIRDEVILEAISMAAGKRKDISTVHVDSVCELLFGETGKEVHLPYSLAAKRVYDKVVIRIAKGSDSESGSAMVELNINGRTVLPDGRTLISQVFEFDGDMGKIPQNIYAKWFDYDKIKSGLCVRKREEGDFFVVNDNGAVQTIKRYFINEKIPADKRNDIWLVADGNHVIWIVGYRISGGCKVGPDTREILSLMMEEIDDGSR